MNKETIIDIITKRHHDLSPDYNKFERNELTKAAGAIKSLIPPEYFEEPCVSSEDYNKLKWIPVTENIDVDTNRYYAVKYNNRLILTGRPYQVVKGNVLIREYRDFSFYVELPDTYEIDKEKS